jgi:hypothetical protein
MTISINPTWNGNTPQHSFDDVNDAVEHIRNNPSYEYLEGKRVRPYGDIDHYTPEGLSLYEFDTLNSAVYLTLQDFFNSANRKVSLYTASSFEKRKISWRWVVPDVVVESRKHAKLFAEDLYNRITFPDGVKGDLAVYNANQKLRMLGTSKPNENRPLVSDGECSLIDTIVTYIPDDAEFMNIDIPAEPTYAPVVCDIPDATLKTLLDCVSVESWTDYAICRSLIWACCSCGIDAGAIHSYASKASNYETRWVDDLIKSHNPAKSANHLFLRKYAKLGNPKLYKSLQLSKKFILAETIDELFALTTDETTIYDSGRYLMELPEDSTLAVKSMLGTGKTERIKQVIEKSTPSSRILVLSGRRTFSDAIYSSIQHQGFVHYEKHKEEKGNKTEITCDRLVIQMSAQSLKLIEKQSYDIVICDEIETLLTMLSPLAIYKKSNQNYLSMIATFERLMKETGRVICLDAFLTDRTLNMLKSLRREVKLIINTTLPYNKKCVEFDNEAVFFRTLKKRIVTDKKKIVSVWGTVKAGKAFHEVLTHEKISNEFYHKASDSKIKARDMADVNTHWATKQSIGYTGTITVGINYTNTQSQFNQLSIYASAWGPGARDYAQALHRAREITDNEVLLFIHPSAKPCSSEAGLSNQEEFWDMENDFKRQCIVDMGESVEDYTQFPEWLKHVVIWNRNEIATNRKYLPELLHKYLELCGIDIHETRESDEKTEKKKQTAVEFDTVRNITSEEAEFLNTHRRGMSEEDHFALEKYYLCELVNGSKNKADQFLWEEWLKNKSCVEHAYMLVHDTANDLLKRQDHKVIELFSKDIPRFKFMKSLLFDWTKSWSLPVENVPVIDLSAFSLRKRTEKDTPEQYCRQLAASIENWCGYAIRVSSKRIRKGEERAYEYTMVYNYEKSIARYIPEKFKFDE